MVLPEHATQARWQTAADWSRTRLRSGTTNNFRGVWSAGKDDLLVVSEEGTILRQRKPR